MTSQTNVYTTLCLTLHSLLFTTYILLLVLWAHDVEHKVIVTPSRASKLSTVITIVSQVIGKIYTALLLLLAQVVALRGISTSRPSLTEVHDITAAWTGLGAACISLWRQVAFSATTLGVLRVTAYLACLSALHITTPSLFSMQNFNMTGGTTVPVTIGMPVIHNATLIEVDGPNPWTIADSVLSYLQLADSDSTIGLANDTIYDIASPITAAGDMPINAHTANVICGHPPNATISYVYLEPNTNITQYYIDLMYGNYNITLNSMNREQQSVLQLVTRYDIQNGTEVPVPLGRDAFFLTTFNVTDQYGNLAPILNSNADNATFSVQVIGCSLSWINRNATVDVATRLLESLDGTPPALSSSWNIWEPTVQLQVATFQNLDNQIDSWADMLECAGRGSDVIEVEGFGRTFLLSTTEQALLTILGGVPINGTVTIAQFEAALRSTTAAAYWAVGHVVDNATQADYVSVLAYEGAATATMSRLNINELQLVVGFTASGTMLLLILTLLRRPRGMRRNALLKDAGVL